MSLTYNSSYRRFLYQLLPHIIMPSNTYITVKLTHEFGILIDSIINNTDFHYETRTEVVKQSIREYYKNLKNEGFLREKPKKQ